MDTSTDSYRRFLDGDENGLIELIRDYKDGLMLYINGYVQNIHTAEDLTEDTFVKLAVKRPRFKGNSSFKTWLYAIGRNAALDHLRKKSDRLSELDTAQISDDEADVERSYIRSERDLALHRSLKKLAPQYRSVLYLSYFEGFDAAQIADILKKNRKQVENLLYRAKQSLRAQLEKEGFAYEEL